MAVSSSAVCVSASDDIISDVTDGNIVIKTEDTVLVKDVDYTLEYKDNVKVGTAKITVHFIGNYSGEKEQTFTIKRKTSGGGGGGSNRPSPTITPSPVPTASPAVSPSPEPTGAPEELEHNSYISGYEDGTFIPDGEITRAETAAMLSRVLASSDKKNESIFSDLVNGAWYIPAVSAMSALGIIKGYPDGTFKPDNQITRAEFVTMLIQCGDIEPYTELPFDDVSSELWSADYIYSAYKVGYIDGYEDGTFRPDSPITRAEAVKIINQALDRIDFDNEINPFSDVSDGHWAYMHILEAAVTHTIK